MPRLSQDGLEAAHGPPDGSDVHGGREWRAQWSSAGREFAAGDEATIQSIRTAHPIGSARRILSPTRRPSPMAAYCQLFLVSQISSATNPAAMSTRPLSSALKSLGSCRSSWGILAACSQRQFSSTPACGAHHQLQHAALTWVGPLTQAVCSRRQCHFLRDGKRRAQRNSQ